MRTIFLAIFILLVNTINAQTTSKEQIISDLPELVITDGINLHIISPEPIQYVDLSTDKLTGDLPTTNIARVKINEADNSSEKLLPGSNVGIITVVAQSFIAQYKAVFRSSNNLNTVTNFHIQAEDMQPIEDNKMIEKFKI